MSIQFLLIGPENRTNLDHNHFVVYQKHIGFLILKGGTYQENVIILFSFDLSTLILEFK